MKFNRRSNYLTHRISLLLCLIFFACAYAQALDGHIQLVVSVSGANGEKIPGASVTINQVGCQCGECPPEVKDCKSECCDTRSNPPTCCIVALTRTSDDDGNATFEVNAGLYRARIEVQNFKAMEVEGIQVGPGQSNKVEVKLEDTANIDEVLIQKNQDKTKPDASKAFKTLTVEVEGEGSVRAQVAVRVRRLGCSCGTCPADKPCPSSCCDCKEGHCVCCIDTYEVTDSKGERSFSVQPGEYEVSFKVAGKSYGTLSGVVVRPDSKEVKLPITISEDLSPK